MRKAFLQRAGTSGSSQIAHCGRSLPFRTTSSTATRQSLRVIAISDHCVDEFDEEETIFINEGDTACKITVQVRGRAKTKSKVLLQYQDYDEGWISAGYKTLTTNASGKATFTLETDFPSEAGDDCYDNDSYTHRFAIARTGKYKAFKSATFEVSYTSSDPQRCSGAKGQKFLQQSWDFLLQEGMERKPLQ